VKKIGTKKQKKLAEKAEKKAQREQMEALRADEKKREAARQEELKKKEIEEENQRQKREQEEKARKERLEREEHEKYLKLKSTFIIEDEGDIQNGNDEKTLQEFIDYIKVRNSHHTSFVGGKVIFVKFFVASFSPQKFSTALDD
jgi:DNA segregation ATPase FtsK/SpoIIIE-like protein